MLCVLYAGRHLPYSVIPGFESWPESNLQVRSKNTLRNVLYHSPGSDKIMEKEFLKYLFILKKVIKI